MKKFLLATVSMVALASATRAADMPAAMPAKAPMYMPAPIADWSGAYLGIQGGVVPRDATLSPFDIPLAGDKTGGIVGALLGYNWQRVQLCLRPGG
jgi:outer membrane immunogenic protein